LFDITSRALASRPTVWIVVGDAYVSLISRSKLPSRMPVAKPRSRLTTCQPQIVIQEGAHSAD
jgi:hypothetical protein